MQSGLPTFIQFDTTTTMTQNVPSHVDPLQSLARASLSMVPLQSQNFEDDLSKTFVVSFPFYSKKK